ncbi:hypothetical protein CAMGR0001_1057 [Campylobacter gracilis RM3268]|uniref:Uncharacterized protein n=1 Tax=Campylobacter gracilis RM3268 TaxID=553220 RepID=C8PGR2_9BACT|nr:hypothetical protein CAMGR0001_1057 [Campylobacter gracilis RM3268]
MKPKSATPIYRCSRHFFALRALPSQFSLIRHLKIPHHQNYQKAFSLIFLL